MLSAKFQGGIHFNTHKYQGGWVPIAIAAVAAVASIAGMVTGSKSAKKAAKREAMLEAKTTNERMYQIDVEQAQTRGETLAASAGSGVQVGSGSVLANLADQATQFARERKITKEVGASRAATALARGKAVAAQATSQGVSNAAAYGLQAVQAYQQYKPSSGAATTPKPTP